MIELRTLGGLDLRSADGAELRSILVQPRRVALLAYLALELPRGFHRRDKLLPLFWAELDAEHARGALRNALHYLRRSLGEGVLLRRGDDEVGLDAKALWCDAAAFEAALAQGRAAEALELYRGHLLQGFFVSDAPGFERWLEGARTRLRERAAQAAWTLADAEEASGNGLGAAQWARSAVAFLPFDESAIRRLIELLDRRGDRAGAIRAYEEWSRQLAEAFDLEPSPETRAVAEGIRARARPAPPAPALLGLGLAGSEPAPRAERGPAPRPRRLLDTLRRVAAGSDPPPTTILLVEEDPETVHLLDAKLAAPGRTLLHASTAAQAQEVLSAQNVSLILLDLVLPDTDGRNLLMRLRERPGTAATPILVLSVKAGGQTQTECFALGADGFFEKPFDPEALAAAVSARLLRPALYDPQLDPVTGLPNRAGLVQAFRRLRTTSEGSGLFSLALLELQATGGQPYSALSDDVVRHAAETLAHHVGSRELVGRWAGAEFVVLFPGLNPARAVLKLKEALHGLQAEAVPGPDTRPLELTFSAGVALAAGSTNLQDAVTDADYLLYLAKTTGHGQIFSAESRITPPRRKIILAEYDELTAKAVGYRLAREGFEVDRYGDGAAALAAALEGTAALVILDVQMPGLDGFQVLERLRRIADPRLPVVMLTALGSEEHILRGFELGADDYIVKPFSPVELVARVHRLLKNR
ncbi:MAG: response regulator [Gemmatimonadetes bacterium]|nr:response regulator [Gemmatimonadota bacterium]